MITPNVEELKALFQGALDTGLFEQDVVRLMVVSLVIFRFHVGSRLAISSVSMGQEIRWLVLSLSNGGKS